MTKHKHRSSLILVAALAFGGMALADQDRAPGAEQRVRLDLGESGQIRVGQTLDPRALHRISRPGLYGLSQSPRGSAYGISQGRLIRYDPASLKVISIIRQVDQILD
ncbi:MAG: hypothetical protein QM682_05925 [Paracoccus sp. (in: a-proteobacteria)]|uniref:hypothetical protein n=1 Tax=Paracoccus sp. TaxID=267 RepID=UPI0039E5F95B